MRPLLQILMGLFIAGCIIKSKSAQVQGNHVAGALTFEAVTVDSTGNVLNNVEVYFHRDQLPIAVSDALGRINFSLLRPILDARSSGHTDPSQGITAKEEDFRLTYLRPANPGLGAVSKEFSFNEEGLINLGNVSLQSLADLKGTVLKLSDSYQQTPANAAEIYLNSRKTTTNERGEFILAEVPSGNLTLKIIDSQGIQHLTEVVSDQAQSTLPNPLVLFGETKIQGVLFSLPKLGDSTVFSNTPLLMNFEIQGSRGAIKVRYHHNKEELVKAAFQPISRFFSYTFPNTGIQRLYLQLADSTEKELSEFLSVGVTIGGRSNDQRIVIGDGSEVISSRKTSLSLKIPEGATSMKIAEAESDLSERGTAQWRVPQDRVEFIFSAAAAMSHVQVFVLFAFDDDKTETYSKSALFMPFPLGSDPIFAIDGGATVTSYQVVRLDIEVPFNAMEMLISANDGQSNGGQPNGGQPNGGQPNGGQQVQWLNISPVHFHVFQSGGLKTVSLRFRDIDGIESPTYTRIIRVDPFIAQPLGFVIGDDSGFANIPDLTIHLIPPYGAITYRIWNDTDSNLPINWGIIVPNFQYVVNDVGAQKLNVQYQNVDGVSSPTFSSVVTLNLFPAPSLTGLINQGAATTGIKNVQITFPTAPIAAIAVRVSENTSALEALPAITLANPVSFTLSDGAGTKIVYFQFVAANGAVSPVFSDTIDLQ